MNPTLQFFSLGISTWRVVVLSGLLLSWALFLWRSRGLGYPFYEMMALVVFALPVGALGAHLFNWLIPALGGQGGYSTYGQTILGSIVACMLYGVLFLKYALKMPPLPVFDALAFTYPLATMVGRFGCLMDGCCFGTPAPVWVYGSWVARLFTVRVGSYAETSSAGAHFRGSAPEMLLWDLPLLFMLVALVVLVAVEYLYRRRDTLRLMPGTCIAAALMLDSTGRIFIEFLRQEEAHGLLINSWQKAVALLWIASFGALVYLLYERRNKTRERHP